MMKLGEKSHRKIEDFFREFLGENDFNLPEIFFYGGKFTHHLTRIFGIEGITIGRRIYIFPENFRISKNNKTRLDEELAVHEITHVLQYKREGFVRFLRLYFGFYWKNLRAKKSWDSSSRADAYRQIPFEIEARQIASKFVIWSANRKLK